MRDRFLEVLTVLVGLVNLTYAGCCLRKMTFPDTPSTSNYAQVNAITSVGLYDVTACLQLRTSNTSVGTLFSYAAVNHTDEVVLSGNDRGEYTLTVNGTSTNDIYLDVNDGRCHTLCFTWESFRNGRWSFYVDGEEVILGSGLASGHAYNGDDMSCFNVWNSILTPRDTELAGRKCGNGGNIFDWSSESWTKHGNVQLRDNQCDAFRYPVMSASSQYNSSQGPDNGVMDFKGTSFLSGAWVAEQADLHQWLKVDLQKTYFVTALITQGRNNCPCHQWITSYYISYGEGNGDENIYKNDTEQMVVFPGNADGDAPVRHELSGYTGAIAARYVTFHPLSWNGNIALRAGVVVRSALEPVGLWPLNEQYGATDATGNGNDGLASGTELVEGLTGPLSQAFLFSDNGPEKSYINITNNGKLDVRFAYTILAHVYPTGVGKGPLFHYRGPGNVAGIHFGLLNFMPHLRTIRRDNSLAVYGLSPAVAESQWHYVGASYNKARRMQELWLESARQSGRAVPSARELATQYPVAVGSLPSGHASGDQFEGRLSCLQLYDYRMDPHQMALVREKCETTCPYGWYPNGFVCYRAFDELVSWEVANARCERAGGRLASVKNISTHNFLVALKNTVHLYFSFWIGLKRDQGGSWAWADGTPLGPFREWGYEGSPDCIPLPEGLHVVGITATSVQVSWQRTTNALVIAQRVWIRRSDTDESLFTHLLPTSATDVTFDDLIPSMEYVISAINIYRHREGPEANLTVTTKTDPPVSLEAMDWTTNTVTISWVPSKAVLIGYDITYTGSGGSTLITKSGDLESCELTGLVPGTRYDIDVVAVGKLGKSVPVSTSVVTDTDPPSCLKVTSVAATWMFLEWEASLANIVFYDLDIADKDGSGRILLSVEGHRTSYNVTDLLAETEYVIKMAAFSAYGRSAVITYSHSTGALHSVELDTAADSLPDTSSSWPTLLLTTSSAGQNIEATSSRMDVPGQLDIGGDVTTNGLQTTTGSDTSPGAPTESPVILQTSTSGGKLYTTHQYKTTENLGGKDVHTIFMERVTESPEEKLHQLAQGIDGTALEASRPGDILEMATSINDIIQSDTTSVLSPSVLKTTAELVRSLAETTRGSQGASVETMEAITTVLMKTASTVLDMAPEQEPPIPSHVDNLFESNLVDIRATDLSPKQQLKKLREEQKEREDTQQLVALSLVASLDQAADTLLTLKPENVEYEASFEIGEVSLVIAKPLSSGNLKLESGNIAVNIPETTSAEETPSLWDVKVAVFQKNPLSWSDSTGGQNISSPVVVLRLNEKNPDINGTTPRVTLDFRRVQSYRTGQPTTPQPHITTETPRVTKGNGTALTYHAFSVPSDDVISVVTMTWWDFRAVYHVYSMDGSRPTVQKYAEKRVVQAAGLEAWFTETDFSVSFVPNTTARGDVLYVGVHELGPADGRGYSLRVNAVACSSWKDRQKQWRLGGCRATVRLNDDVISCTCDMVESRIAVGTSTLPVPNSIDFMNAFQNFLNLSDNAVVFSIVVAEFALYIILMVLLRANFKRKWEKLLTLPKVSLIPPDRMPAPHVYQLTVTTGSMFGAGTTSRIGLQLYGSKGATPIKMLNPGGEALVRGSTLHIVMPVRESLGDVTSLHIWHDNSGEGDTSSWFLRTLLVRDVETDAMYYFICNNWLSDSQGDCEVQMVVYASTQEELRSFPSVFSEATRDVFYDAQLWVSTLVASPGSSFTQAQRLSCCFTLLNTMMLSSAMWYRGGDTTAGTTVYNLGVVQFTAEELYISLMSALTVAPVNMMIVKLFRLEAPLSVHTPEMVVRTSQGCVRRSLYRLARYVAWVTVFLVSTSSAFFVILYSMDWGKEKSDSWLKAFVLSFMGSSCVMDTLQIFAMAVFLAAVCGLPFLAKPPAMRKENMQLNLWNTTVPKKVYPPANANLQMAKKKKDLSKKSASVLMDFLLLFVFVGVLFYIAQAGNDEMALYETQTLSNSVLQEHDAIRTPDQFYSWLLETLLPTLYPAAWYNGWKRKFLDRQFAQNTESFRLGPPRLVQVRQLPGTMKPDKPAGLGWAPFTGNMSDNCWRFEAPNLGNHQKHNSVCTNYHSLDFPLDSITSVSVFSALKDFEYVDRYTESLAIDMNFYNPSLKQFSVVKIFVSHPGIGNLMPTATITSFRMFQYESSDDYVNLLLHIAFIILFLVMLIKTMKAVKEQGWIYFISPWNILECAVLIGTVMIISVFVKRYTVASATLNMVAKTNGELGFENFVDLTTAAWWDAVFRHILGVAVFINTIALIRVVRFSQTISKLLALPSIMKKELVSFLIVAGVAFLAFVSSGHLIFVYHLESYTDLYRTTLALFEMMLGAFVTDHVMETNPVLGPIFFSAFMICIFTLMVNFLMTIICDAISADVEVDHDRDLAEHMWRSVLAKLGMHSVPPTKESKPGELKMEELQTNLRVARERLDESLDICDSLLSSRRQRDRSNMQTSNTRT
ncbi:PKD1L3 [Branchiostoma lanceolatum]|uniref:PKD1L3 protein n=1 Tax=Branchiostoma lanceolatum TaxID=7740 RepID=A0A8K0EII3_BRALA|nr:PKD1L3 [Branchiostoma lanceolatum]